MSPLYSNPSISSRCRALALRLAAAAAGVLLVGAVGEREASAQEIVVQATPPAPRIEIVPRAPAPGYVWAPGYWGWRPHYGHVWYGGRWIVGHPGYHWAPAHWSERGSYWHFRGGHWRR